jgi:EAL domain-containing protein (putative c-di-GMP-specific phosphodiesterase class I)
MSLLSDATILIADDHAPNVALLDQILRRAGATNVHATTDASEVADMFRSLRPDLVMLDLHMPGIDGVEVMAQIRATLPDDDFVPIVFLTADITPDARTKVLASGASDFLTKPVDRTEVVLRARNLLHTRALHRALREHNVELRGEIAARTEIERAIAADLAEKRARVERILGLGTIRIEFQPVFNLSSGEKVAFEALARFDDEPIRTPDRWFAEAFEVGLGEALELLALDCALRQLPDVPEGCVLCVNVSPVTASSAGFGEVLRNHPLERLVVEITEHASVEDYDALHAALDRAGDGRLRLAVDDAGAGFASLTHILRLRPRAIKLDMSLVRDIDEDPVRRALAAALVQFGREIRSVIVAEGIETAAELACLCDLGIDWGQGYHLGRPAPLDAPLRHADR